MDGQSCVSTLLDGEPIAVSRLSREKKPKWTRVQWHRKTISTVHQTVICSPSCVVTLLPCKVSYPQLACSWRTEGYAEQAECLRWMSKLWIRFRCIGMIKLSWYDRKESVPSVSPNSILFHRLIFSPTNDSAQISVQAAIPHITLFSQFRLILLWNFNRVSQVLSLYF
jgi:hypothetical protein